MVRTLQELVATRNQRAEEPAEIWAFCDICKFTTWFLFGTSMVHVTNFHVLFSTYSIDSIVGANFAGVMLGCV